MARITVLQGALLALEATLTVASLAVFGTWYCLQAWPPRPLVECCKPGEEHEYGYGDARPKEVEASRIPETPLAVGVLSLAVFLSRIALLHLSRVPSFIDLLYDVFLYLFWCFTLVSQYLAPSPRESCAVFNVIADVGLGVTIAASVFYAAKIFISGATSLRGRNETSREKDGVRYELLEKQIDQQFWVDAALSPVLAFFPEDGAGEYR